ncbi:hypothetical protein ACG59Z_00925 [Acinetobacter sp. ABJ_C1_1]|uniref:hypothetical protein n=1 Tax=Acinetobacter sp. ABJ_C1_1 TaxID=3378321 RepID=UPI0037DD1B74
MPNLCIKLPVTSSSAQIKLNDVDLSKIVVSKDYEYRYFPLNGNIYSNDLSDKLVPSATTVYSILPDHISFNNNNAANTALRSAYTPPSNVRFQMSGVFTIGTFPASALGMLIGNFNNPSGVNQGSCFYINQSKQLIVLFGGNDSSTLTTLVNVNSPIYVSAIVDKANKTLDYYVVAEGQTFQGRRTTSTLNESSIPISIGNTMQAQASNGIYNCYDFVVDSLNRYADLASYYNDARARMSLKGISI